jgi:hypothetical protein
MPPSSAAPEYDVVEVLYAQAGLDLAKDLARINAAPRIAADPVGVDYARERARSMAASRSPSFT